MLWEGRAKTSKRLRDFVVRPKFPVESSSIVVHLDTARVPGLNEIDSLELVGRDGSRQWAMPQTQHHLRNQVHGDTVSIVRPGAEQLGTS